VVWKTLVKQAVNAVIVPDFGTAVPEDIPERRNTEEQIIEEK
jgi:hypothetical protein